MAQNIRHFTEELGELKHRLLVMGDLAQERLRTAMRALLERDQRMMSDIVQGDEAINRMHLEIDDRCFKLLALYQPMAVDLRTIVAAVKINSDLERVGDLAVNVAEASEQYVKHEPVKPLIDLPRMGSMAQRMLDEALKAFLARDVEMAHTVLTQDDVLDALKDQILRELLTYMLGDTRKIEAAIELILISRHLERVGDHATNIAEDVIFIVEARDVRHRAPDPGWQHGSERRRK
jgi:phosphate transport system protein